LTFIKKKKKKEYKKWSLFL